MANWDKLNKEFDDALEGMDKEKWDVFKDKCDAKKQKTNIGVIPKFKFSEDVLDAARCLSNKINSNEQRKARRDS